MMRLFLAFTLEEPIRQALADVQKRLQESKPDVRWSLSENFHLTVKFLGDIEEERLPDVKDASTWLASESAPFRIRLRGVSTFPKRGPEIKVLWTAVTEGGAEWNRIATKAEEAFTPFGVAREGGLVAHITLGRARSAANRDALRNAIAQEAETDFGEQAVSELILMRSILDPGGAVYEEMGRWTLGEPPIYNS